MQFIDLKAQYEKLKEEIDTRIRQVLEHNIFIMGPEVEEFEQALSAFTGSRHVISCASGTDALQLVFMAYGIGRGDAVFCPDVTFIASVEPACMLGATPVFCDITPDTYDIDPKSLELQIQNVLKAGAHRPRAVVAVDFLGNPAAMDEIRAVCDKYSLLLIEDAAQSFGAQYQGKKCCSLGAVACTSFFPAKPLGCYGDGGAVFTDDDELARICRSLRVHGKGTSKYDNVRVGMNSRLDTIQAAIMLPKLKALEEYEMELRQRVAARYNEAFRGRLTTPHVAQGNISTYAQYALLAANTQQRDRIMAGLKQKGVPTMIYYPTPQHALKVFEGNPYVNCSFENADRYCALTFSLPMHPYLSEADQGFIIETVFDAMKEI